MQYIYRLPRLYHIVCVLWDTLAKTLFQRASSSLIAEITTNSSSGHHKTSDSVLTEMVIDGLEQCGIIKRADIITTEVQNIKFGYVVHDLNYYRNIAIVKDFFESRGIDLLGRFGQFEYLNMDEVMKRSKTLALKLNKNNDRNS